MPPPPAPRRRRAVIHIGTGKTGSTTIQNLLATNRARLIEQGFAYPSSPGQRNHLQLAIHASDERRAAKLARISALAASAAFLRSRIAEELGGEIAALPESVHTVIFSSEHLSNQVASVADAARLKTLLDPWFDDYRILVYLRRQDEYAVSLYSTLLRSGRTSPEMLPPPAGEETPDRHDWAGLLDRWGQAFGRAALLPRIFDRTAFVEGDLLADMRAAIGLAPLPVPDAAAVLNPSLTAPAQEFLRRLNIAARGGMAEDEEDETEHEAETAEPERDAAEEAGKPPSFIRQVLDARFAGPGRRPSAAEAAAFVARYAAGNERIRAEFFPQRASLFSADFSNYPALADPLPTGDVLVEIAIAVALAQNAEHSSLLAEMAARRGRERVADAPDEARRLFRRALGKQPTHVGALRGLVELVADAAGRDEAEARLARALALEPERRELLALRQRLRRMASAGEAPAAVTPGSRPQGRAAPAPKAAAPLDRATPATAKLSLEERAARQERRAERQRRREAAAGGGDGR